MNRQWIRWVFFVLLLVLLLLPNWSHSAVTTYQYDSLNRLVKVSYEGGAIIYTYDRAGNRLTRSISLNGQSLKADLNDDNSISLRDAILALQVLSNWKPAIRLDYTTSGVDIGGNQKIGLEEVLYILQKAAGVR